MAALTLVLPRLAEAENILCAMEEKVTGHDGCAAALSRALAP